MRVFRFVWLVLFSLPVILAILVWFAFAEQGAMPTRSALTAEDLQRAESLLRLHDPRGLHPQQSARIVLSTSELQLIANYLAQQRGLGAARFRARPGRLEMLGTLRRPGVPGRPYLNWAAALVEQGGRLRIRALRLGAIAVPDAVVDLATVRLPWQAYLPAEFRGVLDSVEQLRLDEGEVSIHYRWDPAMLSGARQHLFGSTDPAAIAVYERALRALQREGGGRTGSLTGILPPLFQLAVQRSVERDPTQENRALLLVLGRWADDTRLSAMLPVAGQDVGRFRLSLRGRRDLAQHFIVSALLASGESGDLPETLGVLKELSDAAGGSGFSFRDLTADRAGLRFGRLLTGDAASARTLQQALAAGVSEADLIPEVASLPENLSDRAFRERFGDTNSPTYREMLGMIDARVAQCRLYQR